MTHGMDGMAERVKSYDSAHNRDELTQGIHLLEQRLARSTLFQDTNPHIAVVPSTCQPGCAGLFSLGVTLALSAAEVTGVIEPASNNLAYSFALFFAGLGQFIVAVAEYQRKNTFGFTTWLSYAGFWVGTGFTGILYCTGSFGEEADWPVKGTQCSNILWGFLSLLFWLNTFATTLAVNLLFLFLAITFFLEAAEKSHPSIATATGVWGIITAALSFYIGMAVMNMEVYGKTYLPLIPLKYDFLLRRSGRRLGPYGTRKDVGISLDGDPADNHV